MSAWFASLSLPHVFRGDSSAYGAPHNRRMQRATTWLGLTAVVAESDAPPRRGRDFDVRDE
eukprot:4012944-Amphidinium_carterae.1